MLTVFPCYAPQDRNLARNLSAFLELGTDAQVFLEEGEIRAGESLLSKAADGLQAAVIVLLLSPDSVPARWARREWEPVLFEQPKEYGARLATLLLRACDFPALLRRDAFFDASQEQLPAFRELKRWLIGLDPPPREMEFQPARQKPGASGPFDMEQLYRTLADEPGVFRLAGAEATPQALEFARQSKRDFDGLIWLCCQDQSLASLAGDMASQLGLTLEGELNTNLRVLGELCAQRRLLIVLAGATGEAERLIFGGRSSTLLTSHGSNRPRQTKLPPAVRACGNVPFRLPLVSEIAGSDASGILDDLASNGLVTQLDLRTSRYLTEAGVRSRALARVHAQAVRRRFAVWAKEDSDCEIDLPQLRLALDWALSQEDDEAWALACDLAKRGVAVMKSKGRQAEMFEVLEAVSSAAEHRDDRRTLEDCSREQVWILESWGRLEEAQWIFSKRRAMYEDQMQLDFD